MTLTSTSRRLVFFSVVVVFAGCGKSTSSPGSASPAYAGNTYYGTDSNDAVWKVTMDDQTKAITYAPLEQPVIGAVFSPVGTNGFLNIVPFQGNANTSPSGFPNALSLEIPGETILMRPGDFEQPIVGVQSNTCVSLKAPTTYQFIAFGTSDSMLAAPPVAYGSLQASNIGTAWSFPKLQMFAIDGTDLKPAQLPAGVCAQNQEGFAVTIPQSAATFQQVYNVGVSPAGYFILNQGTAGPNGLPLDPTTGVGLVGVIEPSAPLDAGSIVAARYAGFEARALNSQAFTGLGTTPVAFGLTPGAGTVIQGVGLGADNVTPATALTIDLGSQDAATPGLFKNVTVTVPDLAGVCVQKPFGGFDHNGTPICTLSGGIAVAGNPNGRFVLFITVIDLSTIGYQLDQSPYSTLQFFLYQQ